MEKEEAKKNKKKVCRAWGNENTPDMIPAPSDLIHLFLPPSKLGPRDCMQTGFDLGFLLFNFQSPLYYANTIPLALVLQRLLFDPSHRPFVEKVCVCHLPIDIAPSDLYTSSKKRVEDASS
jgi:hypothetical protein